MAGTPTSTLTTPGSERAIAVLKRWRALERVSLCPQRIGHIVAAALVLTRWKKPTEKGLLL